MWMILDIKFLVCSQVTLTVSEQCEDDTDGGSENDVFVEEASVISHAKAAEMLDD